MPKLVRMTSSERRRGLRVFSGGGVPVRLVSMDHDRTFEVATHLLDLSPQGARVRTVGRIRPGLRVEFDLSRPGRNTRFRATAHVRWSRSEESDGPWKRTVHLAGLRFDDILEARGLLGPLDVWRRAPSPPPACDPRRRHLRFRLSGAEARFSDEGRTLPAVRLRNLSRGGARIASDLAVPEGGRIEMQLSIPGRPGVFRFVGYVRWCRPDPKSWYPQWKAGVAFDAVPAGHDALLRDLTGAASG